MTQEIIIVGIKLQKCCKKSYLLLISSRIHDLQPLINPLPCPSVPNQACTRFFDYVSIPILALIRQ